jgi:hypothetical protein
VGRVKMGVTMMISQLGSGGRLVLGYAVAVEPRGLVLRKKTHG